MPQKSTGFEQMYPNIAEWVNSYGWIEIGDDGQSGSFVRVLNKVVLYGKITMTTRRWTRF